MFGAHLLCGPQVARHGNMIVGRTGAGKSEAWKCLTRSMAQLKKEGVEGEFEKVTVYTINPLSLSNDEIYGCFDPATHEWTDGVLARMMRIICKDESVEQKWVLFDGPVDTLWIERMNTLLDDNKLLTLLSGERISMPAQARRCRSRLHAPHPPPAPQRRQPPSFCLRSPTAPARIRHRTFACARLPPVSRTARPRARPRPCRAVPRHPDGALPCGAASQRCAAAQHCGAESQARRCAAVPRCPYCSR